MQFKTIQRQHSHQFDEGNPLAQKKILFATILTAVMMIFEIVGGWVFNSMALLADGWHMSSHMIALGLAYVAYRAARHYAQDARFSFGTWKIEVLAGYSSAIILMLVAILMAFQSIERIFSPVPIHFNEAIPIAIVGLLVNLICAWLLHDGGHDHGHHHGHSHSHTHSHHAHSGHGHSHDGHDLNHQAAFLHVVADAVTSVLAILALIAGKYFGWNFLDPILGIVGAFLVANWSWSLIRQTGKTLLDAEMDEPVVNEIREAIDELKSEVKITDIHVWKVGKAKFSVILALETSDKNLNADMIRQALSTHEELIHISVEINQISMFNFVSRGT
ncbi:CDF family Co(II)/Ni(II) efflux transporter DmeF [Acinetobacter sp. WCHAc060025]|uniref:CDF family Co(II)/Ni(II) efflux transporter DmeF n=1 Tax=Acinetobacter sp. WCHAc060025 TaxID=2518625 RepID=UPI001023D699|nr:CDF family Co(II)/Ni(II) efflux transporter DmeF [Acinetobacter sp. WCHAc060025]RZG73167.1 cation transporter [Acinetobacter sp. WCHAc060025]